MNEKEDIFWINNIRILFENKNYLDFYPSYNSSRVEQLNSLTRLCIYSTVILYLFNYRADVLYIPISSMIGILLFYYLHKNDKKNKITVKPNLNNNNNIIINKLNKNDNSFDKLNNLDDLNDRLDKEKFITKKSTIDNPFMNPTILDYNTGYVSPGSIIIDKETENMINDNFNHNLFYDIEDAWDSRNSQRQFFTVPSYKIPNDQNAFANWLYKVEDKDLCKVNQNGCDVEPRYYKHSLYY